MFGWNWPSGYGDKIFKCCQCVFTISKLSTLVKGGDTSFEQIWISFMQEFFVPSLVEIGSVVLEKKIFYLSQCFSTISNLSSLEKERGSSVERIWITTTQGCFVPNLDEIDPAILEEKAFKFRQCVSLFRNSLNSPKLSPWKRVWTFIWTNLNFLHRRMLAKFGWNWPNGSGEEDKNVKSLQQRRRRQQQRRRTTDKFWSEKLTWVKKLRLQTLGFLMII